MFLYITGPKPAPPVKPYPYILAFKPLAGYVIIDQVTYQTPVLGHDRSIYTLRRASP
jgi:hypothetical protein